MSDNKPEAGSVFLFPEREELTVISTDRFAEKPRGWFVEEYVGVSIVNAWGLVPDNLRRKWRRWNSWTQFMGFEFSPDFTEAGVYSGMKIHGVNPIARLRRWWGIRQVFWKDRRLM